MSYDVAAIPVETRRYYRKEIHTVVCVHPRRFLPPWQYLRLQVSQEIRARDVLKRWLKRYAQRNNMVTGEQVTLRVAHPTLYLDGDQCPRILALMYAYVDVHLDDCAFLARLADNPRFTMIEVPVSAKIVVTSPQARVP